jgi:outer membrane protein TolC
MELNQAQAAVAQASVSLQQASTRAQLATSELMRPFPGLALPSQPALSTPQEIEHDLNYWQDRVMSDNHELAMVQSDSRIQQLLAQRSSAERLPDPTIGLRYSNEKEGEEKIAGIYVSVPISFGLRSANSEIARYQAEIARQREVSIKRRLEGDVYAAYTQAKNSYLIWQQAQEAAASVRQNADLVARAYSLGESSLSDTLNARRLAVESSLAAAVAQLDANEARYRLLLDAHQLWSVDEHNGEPGK